MYTFVETYTDGECHMRKLTPEVYVCAKAHYMREVEFNENLVMFYVHGNYPVGYYVDEGEWAGALVDSTGDCDQIIRVFK